MLTAGGIRAIVVLVLIAAGAFAVQARGAGSPAANGWDGTLEYTTAHAPFPRVSSLRLRVTHGGVVVYSRVVPLPRDCAIDGCRLAAVAPGRPFELVDLGSDKGPTAVIWLRTGGVHCCTVVRAVSIPDGALAAKNFGNAGARLVILGAPRVFVSADDRFAYLFTSYAESGAPIQIWRFRRGRFVDVTRQFPEKIAADAARWWPLARGEARGVFAAWAADMCALGKKAAVQRELEKGVAAGRFSPPRSEEGGLAGAQYAAALLRKLATWRYCR